AFDSYWDCTARVTRDGRLLGEGSVTVMQWQDGVGQMGIPVKLSEPAGSGARAAVTCSERIEEGQ
ncbi:MAG TPA: hypothetical protein VEU29_02475, partial [Actinomycetota bacterium]|nr:hypothetical protein [Actinomycetota bacterium]